ncbi:MULTISPECIES: hypothetical protein [Deinococcus]|uniref:HTH marR-type domain-containing protein n=1 Tax=Deinococcus rufus TaxID=2136097 RepID=A0ABV7ZC40_9DEIO|nr:hypothetical protein [Deinococcus sp. AB2017081]WQE97455.1 hypothetical protein U2P90_20075 [Deinococcus sp. AB2017081]WQE97478.1 hypothetical protein U2P90_19945 [Deinococcus sp. AB2017081]
MKGGTVEEQIELLNRGVPWEIRRFCDAQIVPITSASRSLKRLEEREIIACFADGVGHNRRVRSIKLTAASRRVAVSADFDEYVLSTLRDLNLEKLDPITREDVARALKRHEDTGSLWGGQIRALSVLAIGTTDNVARGSTDDRYSDQIHDNDEVC